MLLVGGLLMKKVSIVEVKQSTAFTSLHFFRGATCISRKVTVMACGYFVLVYR